MARLYQTQQNNPYQVEAASIAGISPVDPSGNWMPQDQLMKRKEELRSKGQVWGEGGTGVMYNDKFIQQLKPGRNTLEMSQWDTMMREDQGFKDFIDAGDWSYTDAPVQQGMPDSQKPPTLPGSLHHLLGNFGGQFGGFKEGGRVGLYGGGFADQLAGEIMAEDDEFMQVADVTRGDIHNIKTMGMAGYSVHDMLNAGVLSDNITDDEVRGVMEGTITEPITSEKEEKKWFGIF